ncbi:MAG: addiction module protein [Deltaproteobacteria bacterium]|nr:addiction module protein [Deltaproteobacteria bacterium]MDQ3301489.1 addiction module protein [Myxococcota bacterium]
MVRAEEHIQELLKLPVEDRANAAKLLLDSLDGEADPDAEGEWALEIERRLAKIEAGEAKLVPMDEAVTRLHRAARGR